MEAATILSTALGTQFRNGVPTQSLDPACLKLWPSFSWGLYLCGMDLRVLFDVRLWLCCILDPQP